MLPGVVSRRGRVPSRAAERVEWDAGADLVCGMDEVGRGAWAGPLTVAAVVAPRERRLNGIRDSKLLTPRVRAKLALRIRGWACGVGVGHASAEECDRFGMTLALKVAGERALGALEDEGVVPDRILLDGNFDFLRQPGRVRTIVKGDLSSFAIAAASVVAKATRDALMEDESEHFPAYGFESNRGYPAPVHKCALAAFGPTTIHRRTWVFMDGLPWADDPIWGAGELEGHQPSLFDQLGDDPGADDVELDLTALGAVDDEDVLAEIAEEPVRVPRRRRASG
jgi:ribonuclease HII